MRKGLKGFWLVVIGMVFVVGCAGAGEGDVAPTALTQAEEGHDEEGHDEEGHDEEAHAEEESDELVLPEVTAVALNGERLQVVATTGIIGDVVAQVGGDAIALTTLMGPGQDPHSYQAKAQDMTAVANAHVIFINGWGLEQALLPELATIGAGVPIVPISAGIKPLAFAEDDHEHEGGAEAHDHGEIDPHVWWRIENVEQWVENVVDILSAMDPERADLYDDNGDAYLDQLDDLEDLIEAQLDEIPDDKRFLVTNHDTFGYFADEYDFTILGSVLPGASTLAEPSASELSALITKMREHAVCTIFTETTVNDRLVQTIAAELSSCAEVKIMTLYTDAIGPVGSGADSYIGMLQANVTAIVAGLR